MENRQNPIHRRLSYCPKGSKQHGDGFLILIQTDIVFEKLHSSEKAGMDILSIRLKTTKPTWLELCNVYLPNSSTQRNSIDRSLNKPGNSSLILGDLNGHFQI